MSYSRRVHVSELWSSASTQKFSGVWENPSCFSYQETNTDVVLLKRRKKKFSFHGALLFFHFYNKCLAEIILK